MRNTGNGSIQWILHVFCRSLVLVSSYLWPWSKNKFGFEILSSLVSVFFSFTLPIKLLLPPATQVLLLRSKLRSKFPSKVKNVLDLNQSLVLKSYNNDHTPEIDGETGMALNYAGTTIMAVFVPGLLLFMTSQVLNLHFAPTDNPILFKEKGSGHCWRDHELDHGRIVYLPNCNHREGFSSIPLSTWKFQVQSCEAWVTGRRGFRS